jgi:hypothetical protein
MGRGFREVFSVSPRGLGREAQRVVFARIVGELASSFAMVRGVVVLEQGRRGRFVS